MKFSVPIPLAIQGTRESLQSASKRAPPKQSALEDFWNSLPHHEQEQLLTISDAHIVKELTQTLNTHTALDTMTAVEDLKLPLDRKSFSCSALDGRWLSIYDFTRFATCFDVSQLHSFFRSLCIISIDDNSPDSDAREVNSHPSQSLEGLSAILNTPQLLESHYGLLTIKSSELASAYSALASLIESLGDSCKQLVEESKPQELFCRATGELSRLITVSEDQVGMEGSDREFLVKAGASLLSLVFLFENRILQEFDKWSCSQPSTHLSDPDPTGAGKAKRPVYQLFQGVFVGNLVFSIRHKHAEEREYQGAGTSKGARQTKKSKASNKESLGMLLRSGNPNSYYTHPHERTSRLNYAYTGLREGFTRNQLHYNMQPYAYYPHSYDFVQGANWHFHPNQGSNHHRPKIHRSQKDKVFIYTPNNQVSDVQDQHDLLAPRTIKETEVKATQSITAKSQIFLPSTESKSHAMEIMDGKSQGRLDARESTKENCRQQQASRQRKPRKEAFKLAAQGEKSQEEAESNFDLIHSTLCAEVNLAASQKQSTSIKL